MLELPTYRWPALRNVVVGLWERARIFLRRVGGIIVSLTVLLWFLASYPAPPTGATGCGDRIQPGRHAGAGAAAAVRPIGFNWQIAIALVPGMAAREVVGRRARHGVCAVGQRRSIATALSPLIAHSWSLATACSLLAWYVFAPQCLSTLSVLRRETKCWRDPALMTVTCSRSPTRPPS